MTRSRRRLLAAALLLLLLALALFWPGDDEADLPPGPPEGAVAPADERTGVRPLSDPRSPGTASEGRTTEGRGEAPVPPDGVELPEFDKAGPEEEERPVWLTGHLTDADGAPLAEIAVHLVPELRREVVREPRRTLRIRTAEKGPRIVFAFGRITVEGRRVATTDADGRFEVPAPRAAGRYRLAFHRPRWGVLGTIHRTGEHEYVSGRTVRLGEVTVLRGGTIHGVVLDEDGKPLPGAEVSYWPDALGIPRDDLLPPGEPPVESISW
ncbi:MAG: hypothetical protein ACYS99_08405, partial [Planctomycetota bacterium]